MTPIITKKWKWASTTPPERWTITAEAVISPSTAADARGPPVKDRVAGGQGEHRHQGRLGGPVGRAVAPGHGEAGDPGHVRPQQPDDPLVAPGPDLGREQLAGGQQPPAGASRPLGGGRDPAHATMSADSGPTLGAQACRGAVRGSCSTGAARAPW